MTRRHVPESRDPSLSGGADWTGGLALVAALAAITYAIIVLPGGGVRSLGFTAAAVLALLAPAIFAVTVTFVINGALGGFAFVFIPALEIIAGYSPVVAGSALVPVTVVTLLLSGTSGRLAQRIGPRPQLVTGCLLCAAAAVVAALFIAGSRRPTPVPGAALIQTPVPHLACPVTFSNAPGEQG
jgi:hypothetical protein